MMLKKFEEEEEDFLSEAADDYVSLVSIYSTIAGDKRPQVPTSGCFQLMLDFLAFLAKKYGNAFHVTIGPGTPLDKTHEEALHWLKQSYDAGKYGDIDYGVWFHLDQEAIPEKYRLK